MTCRLPIFRSLGSLHIDRSLRITTVLSAQPPSTGTNPDKIKRIAGGEPQVLQAVRRRGAPARPEVGEERQHGRRSGPSRCEQRMARSRRRAENLFKEMVRDWEPRTPTGRTPEPARQGHEAHPRMQEISRRSTPKTRPTASGSRSRNSKRPSRRPGIKRKQENNRRRPRTRAATRTTSPRTRDSRQGDAGHRQSARQEANKGQPATRAAARRRTTEGRAKAGAKPGEHHRRSQARHQENKAGKKRRWREHADGRHGRTRSRRRSDAGMAATSPPGWAACPAGDAKADGRQADGPRGRPEANAAATARPKGTARATRSHRRSKGRRGKPMTGKPDMPMSGQPSRPGRAVGSRAAARRAPGSQRRPARNPRTRPSRTSKKPCRSRRAPRRTSARTSATTRRPRSRTRQSRSWQKRHQGTGEAAQATPREGTGQAARQPRRARRPDAPHADRGLRGDEGASTQGIHKNKNQKTTAESEVAGRGRQGERDHRRGREGTEADGGRRHRGRVRRRASAR